MIAMLTKLLQNNLTLKGRSLLIFLLPAFIFSVIYSVVTYSNYKAITEARLIELKTTVESALSNASSQALRRGVKADLETLAKILIDETELKSVAVLDHENKAFISINESKNNTNENRYVKQIFHNYTVVNKNSDIDFGEELSEGEAKYLGSILYVIDEDSIHGESLLNVLTNSSLLLMITFIVCWPLFVALYKSYSKPLTEVVRNIMDFEKGELSWKDGITEGDKEIVKINSALADAAEKIIEQTNQIKLDKQSLEQKAKELENQVMIATSAREAADKANEQKDIFVKNISHEMRTPLTGVVSGVDLLEQSLSGLLMQLMEIKRNSPINIKNDLDKVVSNFKDSVSCLDITKQSSSILTEMVNDVLESVQDMYQDISLRETAFNLTRSVKSLLESYEPRIKSKNISYEKVVSGDDDKEGIFVKGDWIRISQIFNALTDNAIRFTENGRIKIDVRLTKYSNDVRVQLSVIDSGIGINSEEQVSIFNLFHIGENPTDKRAAGLGTGLTIAKRISESMNGKLWLEKSELAKGSIFRFEVLLPQAELEIEIEAKARQFSKKLIKPPTLLYVEDSSINRHIFQMYCSRAGINLITAENGKEGLQRYKRQSFDALIVDCAMPILNGYKFVSQVRKWEKENNKNSLIIALSADASVRNKEQCLKGGFNAFLTKPYTQTTIDFILKQIKTHQEKANI
ncbi:ATP-binding protein [Aliikangiella maris]|uniref:histidine kinase n=2 Tax=Aliikangiella maris TaxID=3162458 RepID=A0ABV3MTW5_9GAMM